MSVVHRRSRAAAVTLLEMIVVITIFAMLLGFSVALFRNANKDLGVSASAHHVVALVRGAHQIARTTSSPAWIVVNVKENTIALITRETVGEWHLEDKLSTGAFGRDAQVTGGVLVRGRVGQGLELRGSGTINCGEVPVQSPWQGIAIEMWFLRRPGRGKQTLATIGKHLEVSVEGDGQIQGRVGAVRVSSGNVRVPLDSWCRLQLVYGVGELRLYLNDVQVDGKAGSSEWTRNSPLVVGDTRSGFSGIVDEIRVSLVLPQEAYPLPGECRFSFPKGVTVPAGGEFVIHFDTEGRLEAARHADPVRFTLESSADKREIVIGLAGTIER